MNKTLTVIVIAQFFCTSLWFAGNAIIPELTLAFGLNDNSLGDLTAAVQFGFILGTLTFALLNVADRFSPSKVFFACAIVGGLTNLCILFSFNTYFSLIFFRFATGFFLAGIYPVGMKIASDYFDKGLGKSLGFLVGALVLGTAFPHALKAVSSGFSWHLVVIITSGLAMLGGAAMLVFVPDGPYRKPGQKLDLSACFSVFKNRSFRSAAFGYFGHMWELYAFWAFVPVIIANYSKTDYLSDSLSIFSFLVIAIGSLSCMASGYVSEKIGTSNTARIALLISGTCCLLSPIVFHLPNVWMFLGFILVWGFFVIADSPMFSTMVAKTADPSLRGTALTIVNCIGFGITIVSIQLLNYMADNIDTQYLFLILGLGPLFGLLTSRTSPLPN